MRFVWVSAALTATLLGAGCRALLEAGDLDVEGGGGSSTTESSSRTDSGSEAGAGGDAATSAPGASGSTTATATSGPGGGASTTGATASSSASTVSSSSGGPGCGDSTIQEGEECDDGGTEPNDGCDAECQWEGTSCASPIEVSVGLGAEVTIVTTNEGGANESGCGFPGPARFIEVTPEQDGFLTATILREGTTYNTSLINGAACGRDEMQCANGGLSTNAPGGEVMTVVAEAGQPRIFAVAGYGSDVVGTFTLELRLDRGTCGDPIEVVVVDEGSYNCSADLAGQGNDLSASCGGSVGPDVAYRLVRGAADSTQIDIILNSGTDGVLYVSANCNDGAALVCADAVGGAGTERIDDFVLSDSVRTLVVDGNGSTGGPYELYVVGGS